MKKVISKMIVMLMLMPGMTMAQITKCVDSETNGETIRLSIDWESGEVNINNRKLYIIQELTTGVGIRTSSYIDNNGFRKIYSIYQAGSNRGTSETWIVQISINMDGSINNPSDSTVKHLVCSRSFIRPFNKYKYS